MSNSSFSIVTDWSGSCYDGVVEMLATNLQARRVCPFLGAGLSHDSPANLPLAQDLEPPLRRVFGEALNSSLDLLGLSESAGAKARDTIETSRLERLLDALQHSHGRAALEYLSCLDGQIWNKNHAVLASLARASFLPFCITLNFDLLVEFAIAAEGVQCITECPLISSGFKVGSGAQVTCIVKPHGSFTPSTESSDRYMHLSATLSQVGTRPSQKNRRALERTCTACPVLLVAGYSDHDWDVFPIIQELGPLLGHVIWVDYCPTEEEAKERVKKLLSASEEHDWLAKRVAPWLRQTDASATLVVGRVSELLQRISRTLHLDYRLPHESGMKRVPDASRFGISDPDNATTIRTLLSLISLTRHTGGFFDELLSYLGSHPVVSRNAELALKVTRHRAQSAHTDGDIHRALGHMKSVVSSEQELAHDTLADSLLWRGYEYLCVAKRPAPKGRRSVVATIQKPQITNLFLAWHTLAWILLLPVNVAKGLRLIKRAIAFSSSSQAEARRAEASFYKADLLHCWGNLLMLVGPRVGRAFRWYFRIVAKMYERIREQSEDGAELMAHDYYWMRHLEARLLADWEIQDPDQTEKMLSTIAHGCSSRNPFER